MTKPQDNKKGAVLYPEFVSIVCLIIVWFLIITATIIMPWPFHHLHGTVYARSISLITLITSLGILTIYQSLFEVFWIHSSHDTGPSLARLSFLLLTTSIGFLMVYLLFFPTDVQTQTLGSGVSIVLTTLIYCFASSGLMLLALYNFFWIIKRKQCEQDSHPHSRFIRYPDWMTEDLAAYAVQKHLGTVDAERKGSEQYRPLPSPNDGTSQPQILSEVWDTNRGYLTIEIGQRIDSNKDWNWEGYSLQVNVRGKLMSSQHVRKKLQAGM